MDEHIAPLNVAQLNARLTEVAKALGIPVGRARVMLCTLIVSQMLPEATVVKGGMGIKLRFGELGTRATADLDISTQDRGSAFQRDFASRLAAGWGEVPPSKGARKRDPSAANRVAFTASLRAGRAHDPGLRRPHYVTHPYRVSLAFLGVAWGAIDVEISDPELDAGQRGLRQLDPELVAFGSYFGFADVRPVELVDLEYQIAQKIHAVTDPAYARAHDLVDLQLLWLAGPDSIKLSELCRRTFAWRRSHSWPPLPLRSMDGWDLAYADAWQETEIQGATPVLRELSDARAWLSGQIAALAGR